MKKIKNKNIKGVALENEIGQQKCVCVDCESKTSTFLKRVKKKNSFCKFENMNIYCKSCKKTHWMYTSKKLVIISGKKEKAK